MRSNLNQIYKPSWSVSELVPPDFRTPEADVVGSMYVEPLSSERYAVIFSSNTLALWCWSDGLNANGLALCEVARSSVVIELCRIIVSGSMVSSIRKGRLKCDGPAGKYLFKVGADVVDFWKKNHVIIATIIIVSINSRYLNKSNVFFLVIVNWFLDRFLCFSFCKTLDFQFRRSIRFFLQILENKIRTLLTFLGGISCLLVPAIGSNVLVAWSKIRISVVGFIADRTGSLTRDQLFFTPPDIFAFAVAAVLTAGAPLPEPTRFVFGVFTRTYWIPLPAMLTALILPSWASLYKCGGSTTCFCTPSAVWMRIFWFPGGMTRCLLTAGMAGVDDGLLIETDGPWLMVLLLLWSGIWRTVEVLWADAEEVEEVALGSISTAAAAALACFWAVAWETSSLSLAADSSPIFCAWATVRVRGVPVGIPGTTIFELFAIA